MILSKLRVRRSHGVQYIKDLEAVVLPSVFRGRPVLKPGIDGALAAEIEGLCPSGAFGAGPLSIDLGRCVFCGECAMMAPGHVKFTNDFRMAATRREDLVVGVGLPEGVPFDAGVIGDEIRRTFGRAMKMRQVSAGGDASTEMELNASVNVNFDLGRYGIDFVASPRHADALVVTGPVTAAMAEPLEICREAMASPKLIIAAGTDAISGGLFAGSPAVDRSFFDRHAPDLYVPGNPVHPLTFIDGVLRLLRRVK